MIVELHDFLRYRVTSDSQDGVDHLVDLAEFGGNGRCSCQHFDFRIRPELEAGQTPPVTRCKHIDAALIALALDVVKKILTTPPTPGK